MRNLFIVLFVIASISLKGQEMNRKDGRFIEVKGSSEMEVTPDEIFVRITLKEYKRGNSKVDLNTLESKLIKSLTKLRIPKESLSVENVSGYNWDWKKRKPDDFLASKSFVLKLSKLKQMNDLIDMQDPEGLNSVNVQSYSHSLIEDYRKEVKVGAMKAAKEKATYLLESVGAELGELREVQEIDYGYQNPRMMRSNMAMMEMADASGYQSDVAFMTIKIRAEMRVVFGIK